MRRIFFLIGIVLAVSGKGQTRCLSCHQAKDKRHPAASLEAHAAREIECEDCHQVSAKAPAAAGVPHPSLGGRAVEAACYRCHGLRAPGDLLAPGDGPFARRTSTPLLAAGYRLYRVKSCGICHGGPLLPVPNFRAIGTSLKPGALSLFANSLNRGKLRGRCPAGSLSKGSAEELESAFLVSAESSSAGESPSGGGDPARGETLVRSARCITCHPVKGRGGDRAPDLALPGALYREGSLLHWEERFPRCPSFRLTEAERRDITAYLVRGFLRRRRLRGKGAGEGSGNRGSCRRCHEGAPGERMPIDADIGFAAIEAKLAGHPGASFGVLKPEERTALAVYLAATGGQEEKAQEIEGAKDLASAAPGIDCFFCHRRGRRGGDLAPDLGTAGARLRPAYLRRFLSEPEVVRPAISSRMPRFNLRDEEVAALARVLTGWSLPGKGLDAGEWRSGRRLFRRLGCRSCHQRAGRGASVGPPLDKVGTRLNPSFVYQLLLYPRRLAPGSLMPRLVEGPREALDLTTFLTQTPE